MSHRGVELRSKTRRYDVNGRPIQPPYHLEAWCDVCGMPLVAGERHMIETCQAFKAGRNAEDALRGASW